MMCPESDVTLSKDHPQIQDEDPPFPLIDFMP